MENYSLSDIRAVTDGDRDDFGGGWFWIVVLFLFMNGGMGMWGNAAAQGALTRADIFDGFNYNQLENAVRGVQSGLCDGFYAQNTTMLNGFAGTTSAITDVGYRMQNCCCETNRNIDAVRAENYKNTCEITNAIHEEGEATRALINHNTMQELRDNLQAAQLQLGNLSQTQTLISQLRPFPQPAYITCSPYQTSQHNLGCCCA